MVGRAHRCVPRSGRSDEAKARKIKTGVADDELQTDLAAARIGARRPNGSPSSKDHRSQDQAGVGSERTSPDTKSDVAAETHRNDRAGKGREKTKSPPSAIEPVASPLELKPKFDRNEHHRNYMREYMRKRRQKEKRE